MIQILSIGQFSAYGESNTCLHRNWALHELGQVTEIDSTKHEKFADRLRRYAFSRLKLPVDFKNLPLNKKIKKTVSEKSFDLVWIDKGVYIDSSTLAYIKKKQPDCKIVGYSPDNMAERHNQSQNVLRGLRFYDCFVTTKSYIVDTLHDMGAEKVVFVNNAYEPKFHHPYKLSLEEKKRLGGRIGFIGSWEKERCDSILYLAERGLPVRVWGDSKWAEYSGLYPNLTIEPKGLFSEDYNKALSAFDISLCFLRKMNFDLQTTRTMEIPACGSMLVAERTPEHEALFTDRKEAAFFSDNEELFNICSYYLEHEDERSRIAEAGHQRCIESGYSNKNTIKKVLESLGLL